MPAKTALTMIKKSPAVCFLLSSFILAISAFPHQGCQQLVDSSSEQEVSGSDSEFENASFQEVGMDSLPILQMEKEIQEGTYPNFHSVLISKNGKLVYEHYFPGKDEIWGDDLGVIAHKKEDLHDVRSISKSVVSACIGLAIAQGKIYSDTQSVFEFFPEFEKYNIGERSKLTLKHLLNMTSGIEWNEEVPYSDPLNSEIQMITSPNPIEFVLSRPMELAPGKAWKYNGGTTQLLAAILKKTTGLEVDQFAGQFLFKPLGINRFEWVKYPEMELPAAASGLRLRSRDLLKIGMLYSNAGKWNGKQLIPEDWVKRSIQSHIRFGRNNQVGYGYQFWILSANTIVEGQNQSIIAAIGNGDQRIYMDFAHQLIVITTAGNYNLWTIKNDSEALLGDFVYPAILNGD